MNDMKQATSTLLASVHFSLQTVGFVKYKRYRA